MHENGRHSLGSVEILERGDDFILWEEELKSDYDLYPDRLEVHDVVWGDEVFDSPVFVELAQTDALRRLQTVEQLTLPDRYKTIPGSTHFSRWEHAWGSAIFTRHIAEKMGLDEKTIVKMQLKSLLSDVCHTAHSHAGDWLFQGKGAKETLHDDRRLNYAEVVGISGILRRYGFDPTEILSEEKDGIIDSKQPALDVDRVDYTLREAYRWVNQIPEYRSILNKDSFTVRDNQIVVTNKEAAQLLGITYVLLVTEHWQEPAHRLQLELFMESIKRILVARNGVSSDAGTYSPVDLMMVTDDTLARLASEHDDYIPMLDELMTGVSMSEVNNRWHARADRIRTVLSSGLQKGDDRPIEWIAGRYDYLPRSYEIHPSAGSRLRNSKHMQVVPLDKLGQRYINPPFINDHDEVEYLGEGFQSYKDQAIGNVQQDWRAAIIGNEVSTTALRHCIEQNRAQWPEVLARPSMPNAVLRRQLRETVRTSNAVASKFVNFTVHK